MSIYLDAKTQTPELNLDYPKYLQTTEDFLLALHFVDILRDELKEEAESDDVRTLIKGWIHFITLAEKHNYLFLSAEFEVYTNILQAFESKSEEMLAHIKILQKNPPRFQTLFTEEEYCKLQVVTLLNTCGEYQARTELGNLPPAESKKINGWIAKYLKEKK